MHQAPPEALHRARWEIAAVVATGAVFLVFENVLHRKLEFLIPCAVLWVGYVLCSGWRNPSRWREWGFRADTLRPSAAACAAFASVAALGILGWRILRGWQPLPASSWVVFALYPVWGLVQQFVLQALLVSNVRRLGAGSAVCVAVGSALFGIVHLPDVPLAALCAAAGAGWTAIWLRWPNLLPPALTHAWLGALTYYWVLERDPWREMFPAGL